MVGSEKVTGKFIKAWRWEVAESKVNRDLGGGGEKGRVPYRTKGRQKDSAGDEKGLGKKRPIFRKQHKSRSAD